MNSTASWIIRINHWNAFVLIGRWYRPSQKRSSRWTLCMTPHRDFVENKKMKATKPNHGLSGNGSIRRHVKVGPKVNKAQIQKYNINWKLTLCRTTSPNKRLRFSKAELQQVFISEGENPIFMMRSHQSLPLGPVTTMANWGISLFGTSSEPTSVLFCIS